MAQKIAAIIFALLLALPLWAGDPWKDKSYKDWDEKDVRKILNDSPWSKKIQVGGGIHPSLEPPEGGANVAGGGGEGGGEDEDEAKGASNEKEDEDEAAVFLVRWASSRTIREAWVRGQVLGGRIPQADIEKRLPPPNDDYQLILFGPKMSLFEKSDEAALKARTYLSTKKSKQKVASSQVEIVRSSDGKKINGLIFHFPKQAGPGQPLITSDEKELKFVTRAGDAEIKASFDPQKMVDSQGPDF